MKTPLLAFIAFSALGTSLAFAQEVPSAPYLSVPQRSAFLVSNPYVAKDLKLNATQLKASRQALKQYEDGSAKIQSAKEPSQKAIEANDARLANAYLSVLTPAQKETVLRLGVSQIGTEALSDPTIAAKVALTPAQLKKINALLQGFHKHEDDVEGMVGEAMEKILAPKPEADQTAYEKKKMDVFNSYEGERQRIRKEKLAVDKQIEALLTPGQLLTWHKLYTPPVSKKKK